MYLFCYYTTETQLIKIKFLPKKRKKWSCTINLNQNQKYFPVLYNHTKQNYIEGLLQNAGKMFTFFTQFTYYTINLCSHVFSNIHDSNGRTAGRHWNNFLLFLKTANQWLLCIYSQKRKKNMHRCQVLDSRYMFLLKHNSWLYVICQLNTKNSHLSI